MVAYNATAPATPTVTARWRNIEIMLVSSGLGASPHCTGNALAAIRFRQAGSRRRLRIDRVTLVAMAVEIEHGPDVVRHHIDLKAARRTLRARLARLTASCG
jgi:hypothetical protein